MGKLDNIKPIKQKNKTKEDGIRKEILEIFKNSLGIKKEHRNDPIHRVIKFLRRGKKKEAEKIFKNIRPKIKPEQYITEKQEEQILNDFLNEKDQII